MIWLLNRFDDGHIISEYGENAKEKKDDISTIAASFLASYDISGKPIELTSNEGILCGYDYNGNRVIFNEKRAYMESEMFARKVLEDYHVSEEYYSYFLNYYYLYLLYYGLMHMVQKEGYGQAIEGTAFHYLYDLSRTHSDNGEVFCDQEDLSPMEIEALNKARYQAYRLMRMTKLPKKRLEILRHDFLAMLTSYYSAAGLSPIEMSSDVDLEELMKQLSNTPISTKERMNLGLPVSPRVLSYVKRREDSVYKKICPNK